MNESRKSVWVWVGIAVVVIVVVWGGVYWFIHRGSTGPVPVHAPAGQVITGFPQDLILGTATGSAQSAVSVTNSYSIRYSSSTNQYTANWISSSTAADLYSQYQSYASANGWKVINHADTATLKAVYAVNGSSSINVVIVPQTSGGSAVTATYLKIGGQ